MSKTFNTKEKNYYEDGLRNHKKRKVNNRNIKINNYEENINSYEINYNVKNKIDYINAKSVFS